MQPSSDLLPHAGEPSSNPVTVQVLDPRQDNDWDREVLSHPEGSIFHSRAWAEVLCRTYGHTPHYLRFTRDRRTAALVPLMQVSSMVTGNRGVCVPFSDFCAPLVFQDEPAEDVVMQRISNLAAERKWKYSEFRGSFPTVRAEPSARMPVSKSHTTRRSCTFARFYAHTLNLDQTPDALLNRASSSARRALRKAEKSELSVELTDRERGLLQFCKLHALTRRRHGVPPQPHSFFKNIHEHILKRGLGFIALAHLRGQPVGAAMFLHFGKNSLYKFGASDERWQALRCNNLIMWESIKHLAQTGFSLLHLGRTDLEHNGLRRFKLSLGATEELARYVRYGSTSNSTGRPLVASNVLFRTMPAAINRLAGALIYPHLH